MLALALAATESALAQTYPTRLVRVIVAFSPGGVTDIIARTMAPKLAELWGQPVIVENRTGAGGSVGAAAVARSPADGHTLLVHSSGYALNSAINPTLPYDPHKDFVDVAPLASQPMVLVVGPSAGVANVAELIAAAKARPGHVNYGSAGIGSGAHFNSEKLLGVSSAQRSTLLPDTPTIAEAGVAGFEYTFWNGLWAPAGTPAAVVERIGRDLRRVVTLPDVRERLAGLGAEPMSMTPAEFARFVKSEIDDSARIARAAGIRVQ